MPNKPRKPCGYPRCPELTTERYCSKHKQDSSNQYDRERGTAAQRGYDSKWRKARLGYLLKHPLCVECEKQGRVTPATVVDHIKPHKGDKGLFWDVKNWRALCKPCHDRATVKYDGGFGNAIKEKEK